MRGHSLILRQEKHEDCVNNFKGSAGVKLRKSS